ncbi:MAG: MFS transporter [Candidatus Aminicenantes bacterium]|nr:MFS transporter [Candidatus Aminicenantes bacterium]MDH5384127.1 MFS transporter [Candidatus Aminicenantes bacterium]
MNEEKKRKNIFFTFPRTFWIANLMEFFERGAYYGLNSVLAVYLVDVLGFRQQSVGLLQSIVYALTYILPIFGGALGDRLGYRKILLVAFSLLTIGYFAAGNFDTYGLIFLSLLIMATGSGLFKPLITGTVARTTTKENSGFGFGVYYWSINLGAFLAPFFVSWIKGFNWRYVFFSSALWCFLMLLPAAFVYKDPERPENVKPLRKVLKEAMLVLSDSRFMLLIIVYSTFWILYFQMFGSVLWYLRDFIYRAPVDAFMQRIPILRPFKFDAEFVTIINAGTIVLLVVLVSRITKNLKAFPVMAVGIFIGLCGFVVLAFTHSAWMFILGIAVFSIGEMTAHPKYYSYIGLVAPQDKKAVYMGYAFLYGVFGSLIGSNLGAVLYERNMAPIAPPAEAVVSGVPLSPDAFSQVRSFWLIFAALGILCLAGMLLYDRFFSEDTPKTNLRAWRIMLGIYVIITAVGVYFLILSLFLSPQVQWRTLVQSLIMLAFGGGGVLISLRSKT